MLSTDPIFYICTGAIFILFYSFRSALLQTLILTAGSFAMYATEGLAFLILLALSSTLTSVFSFLAASYNRQLAKKAVFLGVLVNLGVLAVFKYKQLFVPLGT